MEEEIALYQSRTHPWFSPNWQMVLSHRQHLTLRSRSTVFQLPLQARRPHLLLLRHNFLRVSITNITESCPHGSTESSVFSKLLLRRVYLDHLYLGCTAQRSRDYLPSTFVRLVAATCKQRTPSPPLSAASRRRSGERVSPTCQRRLPTCNSVCQLGLPKSTSAGSITAWSRPVGPGPNESTPAGVREDEFSLAVLPSTRFCSIVG